MKDFDLVVIAAVAKNNVIGNKGSIPWHISEDLKHFKKLTTNHPIIMGSNTADSFPKALPCRANIVLNPSGYDRDGFYSYKSLEGGLEDIKMGIFDNDYDCSKVYIIGGGMLYKYAMEFADVLEISHVKKSFGGDTYFPEIDMNIWKVVKKESFDDFDFVTYVKDD